MHLEDSYTDRIEELYYYRSEEKFVVRQLLDEILGLHTFKHAFDVGAGHGHLTEALAKRSEHLSLIDINRNYEEPLRKLFPDAKIIIDSINNVVLSRDFDLILLSHHLYYHNASDWITLCQRLYDALLPGGQLLIILNTDTGQWWQIISRFWEKLRPFIGFDYIRASQFVQDLEQISAPKVYPFRFQVWVTPGAPFAEFTGKEMLQISSEDAYKSHESEFLDMEKEFLHVDGNVVLDYHGEIIQLTRS